MDEHHRLECLRLAIAASPNGNLASILEGAGRFWYFVKVGNGDASARCEPVSHLARMLDRRAALARLVDEISEETLRISEAL